MASSHLNYFILILFLLEKGIHATFFEQTSGTTQLLTGASFPSTDVGFAVGESGAIIATTDGGVSWTEQSTHFGFSNWKFTDVSFPTTSVGYASGQFIASCAPGPFCTANHMGVATTTDGGAKWNLITWGTVGIINAVVFLDETRGFAVGASSNGDAVLAVKQDGQPWFRQTRTGFPRLNALSFASVSDGFAVGNSGTVFYWSGSTWNVQTSGTTQHLKGVSCPYKSIAYAVGEAGTVIATTDSGSTWNAQTSGTTQNLNAVSFTSIFVGYAVGDSGTMIATTDGGATWNAQTSGTSMSLNAVSFPCTYAVCYGYAMGSEGTVIHNGPPPTAAPTAKHSSDDLPWILVYVMAGIVGVTAAASAVVLVVRCRRARRSSADEELTQPISPRVPQATQPISCIGTTDTTNPPMNLPLQSCKGVIISPSDQV